MIKWSFLLSLNTFLIIFSMKQWSNLWMESLGGFEKSKPPPEFKVSKMCLKNIKNMLKYISIRHNLVLKNKGHHHI